MSAIKDKIAKLLALATSPNEQEAQAALLKARELMAKHKLRPEECQGQSGAKVVVRTVGVECTKQTDSWALTLGGIIGNRYCCKVYRQHAKGAKKVTVGFAGLEDDFEVCRRVYLYAYQCVKNTAAAQKSARCAMPLAWASATGWRQPSRHRKRSTRNGALSWPCPRRWRTP